MLRRGSCLCGVWLIVQGCTGPMARPPRPPSDLDQQLGGFYPLDAVVEKRDGRAIVYFAIEQDGHVEPVGVLSESAADFGAACRRMLSETVWSPELDAAGNPVRRQAKFQCEFEFRDRSEQRSASGERGPPTGWWRLLYFPLSGQLDQREVRWAFERLIASDALPRCSERVAAMDSDLRFVARVDRFGHIVEQRWQPAPPPAFQECFRAWAAKLEFPRKAGPSVIELDFQRERAGDEPVRDSSPMNVVHLH